MVNTRRTRFMKKKEGRSRVSQPQDDENEVGPDPMVAAPSTHEASSVKSYVEALKSPKKDSKSKRSGWKIQVSPKGDAQMTLEAAFDAGRLVREAKKLKRKALEQDQVEISSETSASSSSSSSETEKESSSDSETSETSEASSVEVPTPSKKVKTNKKNSQVKKLAKQAKKKGDKKSGRSILKHVEEARKVTSDAVGDEMEMELTRFEKLMKEWEKKKVEPYALQRFAARILAFVKEQGIICAVDHAIFQQEIGRIHILEMDMVDTLNKTNDKTTLEAARERANQLLFTVFDSAANERLERSLQGTTWFYGGNVDSITNNQDVSNDEVAMQSSIPQLESVDDQIRLDWEQRQELNRPATPPPDSQGTLMIDENVNQSDDPNLELYPNTPPPNQQAATAEDGLPDREVSLKEPLSSSMDPQRVDQDLVQLSGNMDPSQWRVLHKLHSSSMNHDREIESLQEQVGPQMTTTHYFLNGEAEPQFFSNTHTINENILGLKNSGLRTRRSFDTHVTKYNQEIQMLKSSISSLKESIKNLPKTPISSCPDANPNADEIIRHKEELKKIQEDLKTALAKASSLSNGSAFNTLDLTARIVELENANLRLNRRWECTSKAVGLLKNERPAADQGSSILEFEVKRLTERIEKLEKEDSDRHSRNLFADLSDSKISLLEKDVEELQKSVRLQLADSETNLWLKRKLEAFLETPEMANKFKSELRNFSNIWIIQPRNLSKEIRELMVKDALPDIKKETLATFEAQQHRMKRMAQEGMAKIEDIPSSMNLTETKRALDLNLKTDMKKAMNIISNAMMDLLTGIEDIFMNASEMNGTEMNTLDVIMGGKVLVKFVRSLSSSDEGLLRMIEDLRVWEFLAPLIKKDKLNALIVALKALKSPVKASTVLMMVKEGVPTRLDDLVDHLTEATVKELGNLDLITVAPWTALSTRSAIEMSSTSVTDPVPLHTSSRTSVTMEQPRNDASTRMTLDKIKQRFRNASSALDKQ